MKTTLLRSAIDEQPGAGTGGAPVTTRLQRLAVPVDGDRLRGDIVMPLHARGIALFADATTQGALRNEQIGSVLTTMGLGTAMFRLLTADEEAKDAGSFYWRFDIELLARRLVSVTQALMRERICENVPLGFVATSGAAAAAIVAAVELGGDVQAIVARDGRPDLAESALGRLTIPTLLVVRREEEHLIQLNRRAAQKMRCAASISLVGSTDDLFEEAREIGVLAAQWLLRHLQPRLPP